MDAGGSSTPCKGACNCSARWARRRCLFALDARSLRVASQCLVPTLARDGPSCAALSRAWLGCCVSRWCGDEASRTTRHGWTCAQSVDTSSDAARRAQASRERTRALCLGADSNLSLAPVDFCWRATVLLLHKPQTLRTRKRHIGDVFGRTATQVAPRSHIFARRNRSPTSVSSNV